MCKYGIWGFERRGERVIDFSKYTREAIQKEMLSQVDTHIDTREGSLVQTAIGPVEKKFLRAKKHWCMR